MDEPGSFRLMGTFKGPTRGQHKEGDKDARPPVLSAKSPAEATTQNQRSHLGS